ncbi:MAG: hypothetical protein ACFFAS_06915 [Promethearchaeota archaeon]
MTLLLNQSDIQVSKRIAIPIAEKIKQLFESGMKLERAFLKAFEFFDINNQVSTKYWELTKFNLEENKKKQLIEQIKLETAFLVEGLMEKSESLKKMVAFLEGFKTNESKTKKPSSPIPKRIEINKGTFSVKKVDAGAIVKIKKKPKKEAQTFKVSCDSPDLEAFAQPLNPKNKKKKKGTYLVSCRPKENND